MAQYLENFHLSEITEDETAFTNFLSVVAKEGKPITGYYGLPYLNRHFGELQMILRVDQGRSDSCLEVKGADTHAAGRAVWECLLEDIDMNLKNGDKLSRRIMVTKQDGSGGMAVVTLVNADVLPSFLEGDSVKMQMIGFPELIQYFADEDAYAEAQPSLRNGMKFMLQDGGVFPSGFMRSRDTDNPERESNEHLDDITNIRATVKKCRYGTITIGEESYKSFIFCDVDTEFGPLQIIHTVDQVDKNQRPNMKKGAVVNFYGLLSGDVAIYEYENGIVRDAKHDLAALRYVFCGNDPERIRSILSEDCVYYSGSSDRVYSGPDAVIERLQYVQKNHVGETFAHLATITEPDAGTEQLPYPPGTRCIILAYGKETNYSSIAFIDVDKEGNIARITTAPDPRYHFVLDEKPAKKSMFEGFEPPKSVVEPILNRARFQGVIGEEIEDGMILNDTEESAAYENNIQGLLENMPGDSDENRDRILANMFGYLFAKAIEKEYSRINGEASNKNPSWLLTARYVPTDAWAGVIHSTLDLERHKKLEEAMILGRQFYKDFKIYQERTSSEEYDDNLHRALTIVQRLGRYYSSKCLD